MTVQTGKVLMTLRSGIELEIAALSLMVRNQLQVAAFQAIPLPDPKPFEVTIEGMQYAGDVKPAVIPADENPTYIALVQETRQKQADWVTEKAVDICVQCAGRDALIEAYAPNLAAMRTIMSDIPNTDWLATLKVFLTTTQEYAAIIRAISQALPLTDQEVRDTLGYFRVRVSGDDIPRSNTRQIPPGSSGSSTGAGRPASK